MQVYLGIIVTLVVKSNKSLKSNNTNLTANISCWTYYILLVEKFYNLDNITKIYVIKDSKCYVYRILLCPCQNCSLHILLVCYHVWLQE